MIGSEYFSGALADNHIGSHGVAGRDRWHERPIRDTDQLRYLVGDAAVNDVDSSHM